MAAEWFRGGLETFYLISTFFNTCVGVPFNLAAFAIFLTKQFREITMFRYLAVVVLFNSFSLSFLVVFWYYPFFVTTPVCRAFSYLAYVFFKVSSWATAAVSADHVFAILTPFKLQFRKTLWFQLCVIIGIIGSMCLVDVPIALDYQLISLGNYSYCGTVLYNTYFNMSILVNVILPFVVMFVCTIIISVTLIRTNKRLKKSETAKSKDTKLTRVFLTLNILYLVTHFPYAVIMFIMQFQISAETLTLLLDALHISSTFSYIYKTFSFLIFIFSNTLFREKVYSIVCCCRRSKDGKTKKTATSTKTRTTNA